MLETVEWLTAGKVFVALVIIAFLISLVMATLHTLATMKVVDEQGNIINKKGKHK